MATQVIESLLAQLESEVSEVFYALNGVESDLSPVLTPPTPCDPSGEPTGEPMESPVAQRLRSLITEVRSRLQQISDLRSRIEVDGSDACKAAV